MVAKIITGTKLRGALHYNEHKVQDGKAELILASGFAGNIDSMNFNQKLQRFEHLLMLKPKVKTNTLHISLNFDSTERLDNEKLQRIAVAYMDKIGFGDQPFLAYRHHDAAHDHIHLVTTNIQANGEAINLHNLGCIWSEKARKEIEIEFNLLKAQSKKYKSEPAIKAIDLEKINYGHIPTKRAISNVVNAVINAYKFSSLAELNAVLKQFNVLADRGEEDTPMFQKKGLTYSLLDENGNKIGIPIKSSSFYTKPTLSRLEQQFAKHKDHKITRKSGLKKAIDHVIQQQPQNLQEFVAALKMQGIAVVLRQNATGQIYGVTFVDHRKKVVFNGSDLGKAYAIKALIGQFAKLDNLQKARNVLQKSTEIRETSTNSIDKLLPFQHNSVHIDLHPRLPEILLKEEHDYTGVMPKQRKKKKKRIHI